MKKITIVTAVILLIGSATLVMAGPRGSEGRWGGGWCAARVDVAPLNLTDEQAEKVRVLRESCLKELAPIRVQLVSKRAEMRLLWMQTKLDSDKIRATQREIRDLMVQMQEKHTDCRLAFRNILTPEQTSRFLAQGFGRGKGRGWGGRHGGRGSGGGYGCPYQN